MISFRALLTLSSCSLILMADNSQAQSIPPEGPLSVTYTATQTQLPALIEQMHVADLLDPLRRGLVRRVRAGGYVIEGERLLRRGVVQTFNVVDGLVCHVGSEIVPGLSDPRKNLRLVAEECRPPIGVADRSTDVFTLPAAASAPRISHYGP